MSFKFTFREITPEDTEILRMLKLRNAKPEEHICCEILRGDGIIRAGMQKEALDKLLQTGDYTVESKRVTRRVGWFAGAYWCGVTAVYLGVSFRSNSWNISWWIWAVMRC